MTAYYNEHDPFAAAWLRELIKDNLIAPGDVDERSIEDVTPNDVADYTQVHWFAGIGGWSLALRLAGWPDDRPVWTGSAPCQPFSEAGKRGGFADERHLWPAFLWHIRQCQPDTIFGEQVSSKAGLGWFDVVSADLEASGYSVGAFDLCAAGVGAFHLRQRLYFVASLGENAQRVGRRGWSDGNSRGEEWALQVAGLLRTAGDMENPASNGQSGQGAQGQIKEGRQPGSPKNGELSHGFEGRGSNGVAQGDTENQRLQRNGAGGQQITDSRHEKEESQRAGSGNFWADVEWLQCSDGKQRPTKPGIFPLAHGFSNRVGILRGAGNAIVPPLAAEFIKVYTEAVTE